MLYIQSKLSRHTKKLKIGPKIRRKKKSVNRIRTRNNSYSKTLLDTSYMFKKIKGNKSMMSREMIYIFMRPKWNF